MTTAPKQICHTTGHRTVLLVAGLCLIAAVGRLLCLTAEPPGLYFNADEGHQNSDARSVVLGGSVFDDPYTPAVLMPVFTAIKSAGMKCFGVNLVAIRAPSVLFTALGVLCLGLLWLRRPLAACATVVLLTVPFYFFVHARLGIHEPILFGLSALLALLLQRAIDRDSLPAYLAVGALLPLLPLTKPSGVYAVGMVAATLAVLAWRGRRVNPRHTAAGAAAAAAVAAGAWLLWIQPHRDAFDAFVTLEVGGKANPALLASVVDFAERLFKVSPFLALGAGTALCLTLYRVMRAPGRLSTTEVILGAWFISAAAALIYSRYKPARFYLWCLPAAAAMTGMVMHHLVEVLRPRHWPRATVDAAVVTGLLLALAAGHTRFYRGYFQELTYFIRDNSAAVEALVGNHPVTGSGFDDFSAASSRIKLISGHHVRLADCPRWKAAFGGREPVFVSRYIGRDPAAVINREGPAMISRISECSDTNRLYRPYLIVTHYPANSRIQRSFNLWFVRRDHQPPPVPNLQQQLRAIAKAPVAVDRLNPALPKPGTNP